MFPADPQFPSGFQNERLADMFKYELYKYDVICL